MSDADAIVITGIGFAIPLGIDPERIVARALAGDSGIGALRRFSTDGHACAAAGEVPPFDLSPSLRIPKNAKFMSRSVSCAVRAAGSAVGSGLQNVDPQRVGIFTGSGQTGLESSEFFAALELAETGDEAQTFRNLGGRPSRLLDRFWSLRTLANAGLALLAAEFSARGSCGNFVQGDTASAQALAAGYFDVLEGRADVALVGGYDCLLLPSAYLSFERAGLLSASARETAYRPFDRERDGLVLAEGATFVILERRERARTRGAAEWGELVGVGLAQVPDEVPSPRIPMSRDTARAAIRDAAGGLSPDVVIAHGIGTQPDDAEEARLLSDLGLTDVPVTALKGLTGYLGAASAITELGIGMLAARRCAVPPVAHLTATDDGCPLDLVIDSPRALSSAAPLVLAMSWSWSGQCSAIAVRV
jgi:3-oxoacyl-(acyl-carrier-protein) synthase